MYVSAYVCIYNEALFGSPGDNLRIGRERQEQW